MDGVIYKCTTSQSRVVEINKSVAAAPISNTAGENRVASQRPKSTPNKLVVINAAAAPAKTIQGAWDSALISNVAT